MFVLKHEIKTHGAIQDQPCQRGNINTHFKQLATNKLPGRRYLGKVSWNYGIFLSGLSIVTAAECTKARILFASASDPGSGWALG